MCLAVCWSSTASMKCTLKRDISHLLGSKISNLLVLIGNLMSLPLLKETLEHLLHVSGSLVENLLFFFILGDLDLLLSDRTCVPLVLPPDGCGCSSLYISTTLRSRIESYFFASFCYFRWWLLLGRIRERRSQNSTLIRFVTHLLPLQVERATSWWMLTDCSDSGTSLCTS